MNKNGPRQVPRPKVLSEANALAQGGSISGGYSPPPLPPRGAGQGRVVVRSVQRVMPCGRTEAV
jgi:hypothetical protein